MKVLALVGKGDGTCNFGIFEVGEDLAPTQIGGLQTVDVVAGMPCTDVVLANNWKGLANLMGHRILEDAVPVSECSSDVIEALSPWMHVDDNLQEAQD